MSPPNPSKLEELLVELGSQDVPGETEHRYALRRALLNSHLFDGPSRATVLWMRLVRLRAPLLAGGIAVSAFIIVFSLNGAGELESGTVLATNQSGAVPELVSSDTSVRTVETAPTTRHLPTATLASTSAAPVPVSDLFQSFHHFSTAGQ